MNLFDFPLSIQTNFGPCPRKKTKKKNCWILRDIEKHAVALDLSRMFPNTPVFMYIYDWTSYVHIYNAYERETTVRETLSPPTVHQSFPEFEMSILICFFVYRIHCFWFVMRFCVFFLFNTPRRNPIRDARVVLGRTGREEFYFILFCFFQYISGFRYRCTAISYLLASKKKKKKWDVCREDSTAASRKYVDGK